MDKHELFETWAPEKSVWSAWAKPVLFAHLPRSLTPLEPTAPPDLSWVPPVSERWALVVDQPGVEAVTLGVALAERGYRPVPLFNACPPPQVLHPEQAGRLSLIDVDSILAALVQYAERLGQIALPADAPPAFLVDANRQRPLRPSGPGLFDNRSVLFVTDFPSAAFLASRHIERVLLLCDRPGGIDRDLAYVLWCWQRAGILLSYQSLTEPGPIQPFTIGGHWLLFNLWHRIASAFRLRRNPLGGFGGLVPEATSG